MKNSNHIHSLTLSEVTYMLLGVLATTFGLKGFLIPNQFIDGGITGVSLLLHEIFHIKIGLLIILLNLPFIIIGSFQVNKMFAIKTLASIILLAIALDYIPIPIVSQQKWLDSIFGGFFVGLGLGLSMRGGSALDGIEVLALYTLKRSSFTISEIILAFNIIIFLIAAFHFGVDTALYAMVTYYIAYRTTDYVIEGLEEYTGVTIISAKSEQLKQALVLQMGRGITIYKGERGYLKESFDVRSECDIVYTITTRLEVRRLKNLILSIDPHAFVFTNTIKEAAGGVLKRKVSH